MTRPKFNIVLVITFCLDNAAAVNFFGLLKSEMYHSYRFRGVD